MSTATAPAERKPEITQEPGALISKGVRSRPLFDPEIIKRATKDSFLKLNPVKVAKNPVMFVVEVGAALTTIFVIKDAIGGAGGVFFGVQIAFWLWFTVVFANFAEAMAEARGKAQAVVADQTRICIGWQIQQRCAIHGKTGYRLSRPGATPGRLES